MISSKKALFVLLKYLFVLILGFNNLFLFYAVLTPLTIYFSYLILSIFFETALAGQSIFLGIHEIEIVFACVAGSAYYLLFFLTMSLSIDTKKRLKILLASFGILFLFNNLRIILMSVLLYYDLPYFNATHKILWYGISVLFVAFIWIFNVYYFKIKQYPFEKDYFTIKELVTKNFKKSKTRKKNN
jgi:exosortase/archaeosortase family protein